MFTSLSFKQFQKLAKEGKRIAVYREFSSDLITPIMAHYALSQIESELILFESGEKSDGMSRYSHLGFQPIAEIRASGREIKIREGRKHRTEEGNPFELLRRLHAKYRCFSDQELLGFAGGVAGFVSYDAIRYVETIPDSNQNQQAVPDLFFQFFDRSITIDHLKGVALIVVVVEVDDETVQEAYQEGMKRIDEIYERISSSSNFEKRVKQSARIDVKIEPDDASFKEMIEKAKGYINQGDAFQIVPSHCFRVPLSVSPVEVYRSMRLITPAPYMFFFQQKDFAITGASPEKLVSLHGKELEAIPLAGTLPRGKTEAEDLAAEKMLLSDPKEMAEHLMLVDLGRNDLGKISKPGSVYVKELAFVQRFSHVMHIASVLRGEIQENYDAFDVLCATFPAGTLSGAPKIRAMEIIDELEPYRRGPYGGAVCFFDHKGDLESCIGLRMAVIKDKVATVQTGVGVVYDSDLEKEVNESHQKARGVLEAIFAAEGGEI